MERRAKSISSKYRKQIYFRIYLSMQIITFIPIIVIIIFNAYWLCIYPCVSSHIHRLGHHGFFQVFSYPLLTDFLRMIKHFFRLYISILTYFHMSKDLEFIYNCDDCHVFILTKPFLSAGLNSNTFTTVRTPYITIFLSG